MARYTEKNCPENVVIRVWHNRCEERGEGEPRWITRCSLFYLEDKTFAHPICSGFSYCHHKDQPNRKIGRAIAVGRALKELSKLRAEGDTH